MGFDIRSIKEQASESMNVISSLKILHGDGDESQINTISINAAAFLLLAKKVKSLEEGYIKAKNALINNNVWETFINVVKEYGGSEEKIYKLIDIQK